MYALVAGIEAAGSDDPAEIQKALNGLSYDSVIGKIQWSATNHGGPAADYMAINTITNNALETTDYSKDKISELLAK